MDLPHQETAFEEQRSGRGNEAAGGLLHSSVLAQLRERLTQLFFIAEGTEHAENELLTKRKCIKEEYEWYDGHFMIGIITKHNLKQLSLRKCSELIVKLTKKPQVTHRIKHETLKVEGPK